MIVCCGEALIDMLPESEGEGTAAFQPVPGGAALNSAIALGRLGVPAGIFCGMSSDEHGGMLCDTLQRSSVSLDFCVRSPRPTTLAYVRFEAGSARYVFEDEGSAGRMLTADDLPDFGAGVETLVFGGISLVPEPCGSAFETLMRREAKARIIYLDPNIRPALIADPQSHKARIRRMMALSDVIKLSDEDLFWIEPEQKERDVISSWLNKGPSVVLLTRGSKGAELHARSGMIAVDAPAAEVVDTVGAGDIFSAGFLAGLRRDGILDKRRLQSVEANHLRSALSGAVRAASISVSRAGADPPYLSELG